MTNKEYQLFIAVENNEVDLVDKLIKPGLFSRKTNLMALNDFGSTVLHVSVIHGHISVVRKLLAAGAKVNAIDGDGRTALHHAVMKHFTDIVRFLLQRGINPRLRDEDGQTAMDYALQFGLQDIQEILKKSRG